MKMTKRIAAMVLCGVMAATSMVGISASAKYDVSNTTISAAEKPDVIIQESQVGNYFETTSGYGLITVTRDDVTLSNLYICNKMIHAVISRTSPNGNAWCLKLGSSACVLSAGAYYEYSDGKWVIGYEDLYFNVNGAVYKTNNPMNPQWEITIGNQTFLEKI